MREAFRALSRWFGFAFYVLIAFFAVLYLSTLDWAAISQIRPNWWLIAVATALGLAARYWYAGIWVYFLKNLGAKLAPGQLVELLEVYAKSWLGRYIPGSVAWVLGKIYFASKLGISKTRLAISSFLEAVLQIVVVLITASLLLIVDPRSYELAGQWVWLLVATALVGLIVVWPPLLSRAVSWLYEFVKGAVLEVSSLPTNRTLVTGMLAFAVSSLISGSAFFFVAWAVDPTIGWREFLFILAASNIASAVSMVTIFAPAGLGVREAIQIAALILVMDAETAVVATILMRLLSIVWDAIFLAIAKLVRRARLSE
jgi:glycosyltransferase 2 family protein